MPASVIGQFSSISLAALKDKAELMSRRDNKYVLNTSCMRDFLGYTRASFDILEIDGKRQFAYASLYFDSEQWHTHQDHNKGRRRRIKMRHRHYVDSDKHYLELKLKGFRNMTQKYRVRIQPDQLLLNDELHPDLQLFCQNTLLEQGYPCWPHAFVPSIVVYYDRITLVAKHGDQRITIDNRISFAHKPGQPRLFLNDNRWIVEVKSSTGRTDTDRWLLRSRQRTAAQCSKYGMGINLLKQQTVNNRFSATLRQKFNNHSVGEQD